MVWNCMSRTRRFSVQVLFIHQPCTATWRRPLYLWKYPTTKHTSTTVKQLSGALQYWQWHSLSLHWIHLLDWEDTIEGNPWLELFYPFIAVKNIYLSEDLAPGIASTLQELGGTMAEVLPSLQNIFVKGLEPSGPFQENVGQFIAVWQLSNHPITISVWDKF